MYEIDLSQSIAEEPEIEDIELDLEKNSTFSSEIDFDCLVADLSKAFVLKHMNMSDKQLKENEKSLLLPDASGAKTILCSICNAKLEKCKCKELSSKLEESGLEVLRDVSRAKRIELSLQKDTNAGASSERSEYKERPGKSIEFIEKDPDTEESSDHHSGGHELNIEDFERDLKSLGIDTTSDKKGSVQFMDIQFNPTISGSISSSETGEDIEYVYGENHPPEEKRGLSHDQEDHNSKVSEMTSEEYSKAFSGEPILDLNIAKNLAQDVLKEVQKMGEIPFHTQADDHSESNLTSQTSYTISQSDNSSICISCKNQLINNLKTVSANMALIAEKMESLMSVPSQMQQGKLSVGEYYAKLEKNSTSGECFTLPKDGNMNFNTALVAYSHNTTLMKLNSLEKKIEDRFNEISSDVANVTGHYQDALDKLVVMESTFHELKNKLDSHQTMISETNIQLKKLVNYLRDESVESEGTQSTIHKNIPKPSVSSMPNIVDMGSHKALNMAKNIKDALPASDKENISYEVIMDFCQSLHKSPEVFKDMFIRYNLKPQSWVDSQEMIITKWSDRPILKQIIALLSHMSQERRSQSISVHDILREEPQTSRQKTRFNTTDVNRKMLDSISQGLENISQSARSEPQERQKTTGKIDIFGLMKSLN